MLLLSNVVACVSTITPCASLEVVVELLLHSQSLGLVDLFQGNDNDNETQRSPSNSRQSPGLTSVSVGVMTPRKSLLELVRLAVLASLALAHS